MTGAATVQLPFLAAHAGTLTIIAAVEYSVPMPHSLPYYLAISTECIPSLKFERVLSFEQNSFNST